MSLVIEFQTKHSKKKRERRERERENNLKYIKEIQINFFGTNMARQKSTHWSNQENGNGY